jgi:hypothetical protein
VSTGTDQQQLRFLTDQASAEEIAVTVNAIKRVPDADIPVHIVSYGGVGSKMLVKWLYPDREPSYQERAHHHWRFPPSGVGENQRFIYVFGDPRNTVISFFQRKLSRHGGHGFEWSEKHLQPYRQWTTLAVKNLEAEPVGLTPEWELADMLGREVDAFQFEDHFRRWLSYAGELPVTFLRYESMWDRISLTSALFNGDPSAFPERSPRRADWQSESKEIGEGLTNLYGKFAAYLSELPDVFVISDAKIKAL